jgi:hypothetical protein
MKQYLIGNDKGPVQSGFRDVSADKNVNVSILVTQLKYILKPVICHTLNTLLMAGPPGRSSAQISI